MQLRAIINQSRRLALVLPVAALCACAGNPLDFDFDFRPNALNSNAETADRPNPDERGLISYDSYQVAVARQGDTVASVASRIGLSAEELAEFNGRATDDELRADEILALPRRVPGGSTNAGTDIAALARGAIDDAETAGAANAPGPLGSEPVRHQVGRGETAYSIARLYGVSVRSLAEWNGLGPDLAVREDQYLLIPIVIASAETSGGTAPGDTVAPLPPSAAQPLPDGIETAELPPLEDTGTGPTPQAAPEAPQAPAPTAAAPAATPEPSSNAPFVRPVAGNILRGFSQSSEGIDIAAATGTPVRAAGDGTVAAITQDTDQVPILVVRHANGLLTIYANIQDIAVRRGDRVSRGQTVANVGGGSPSFLHFEVRRGFEAVDPAEYLP